MKTYPLLEIAVETMEAAEAAQRAGADRVELCAELQASGITPPTSVLNAVRKKLRIPIFVMVRPRPGDFVYSAAEFQEMKTSVAAAKNAGADAVVFGVLTPARTVDIHRTRDLVTLAQPLPVTFHRAFDETNDLSQALEDVIQTGATRILTSGGAKSALEGVNAIAQLVKTAAERITIVPGAGINAKIISQIAATTKAKEFHAGLSSAFPYPRADHTAFELSVRELAAKLQSLTS